MKSLKHSLITLSFSALTCALAAVPTPTSLGALPLSGVREAKSPPTSIMNSTSGVYSPACSDLAESVQTRTWDSGNVRYVEFTNGGSIKLAAHIRYNQNQHSVIKGLNDDFKPGATFKFSQLTTRPAAYRIVVFDAKHIADLFTKGEKSECAVMADKLIDRLHKELCDEIGGSQSCYPEQR